MSGQRDGHQHAIRVAERQPIDRVCTQFRAAWDAGQRPRIEDFLAAASDSGRAELLQRLVAQALAYRSRSGERPTPDRRHPAGRDALSANP